MWTMTKYLTSQNGQEIQGRAHWVKLVSNNSTQKPMDGLTFGNSCWSRDSKNNWKWQPRNLRHNNFYFWKILMLSAVRIGIRRFRNVECKNIGKCLWNWWNQNDWIHENLRPKRWWTSQSVGVYGILQKRTCACIATSRYVGDSWIGFKNTFEGQQMAANLSPSEAELFKAEL